jgi:hypothetical protein
MVSTLLESFGSISSCTCVILNPACPSMESVHERAQLSPSFSNLILQASFDKNMPFILLPVDAPVDINTSNDRFG